MFLHNARPPTYGREHPLTNPLTPSGSVQPIVESQPWHLGEVAGVAGQERGFVDERDAGDLKVHGPDAYAFSSKAGEQIGGIGVPWEHVPRRKELDAALQPLIGEDLAVWVGEAMDFSQPAAQLLFYRHNGGRSIFFYAYQIPCQNPGIPQQVVGRGFLPLPRGNCGGARERCGPHLAGCRLGPSLRL